jgi:hypothetical protein
VLSLRDSEDEIQPQVEKLNYRHSVPSDRAIFFAPFE